MHLNIAIIFPLWLLVPCAHSLRGGTAWQEDLLDYMVENYEHELRDDGGVPDWLIPLLPDHLQKRVLQGCDCLVGSSNLKEGKYGQCVACYNN